MNDLTLIPTILIIDDEPLARRRLINLLGDIKDLFPHSIVGEAGSFEEGLYKANNLGPNLIFMDINMPDGSGLDLTAMLTGKSEVIFLTARDDCALSAFNLDAADYLLKPVKADRLNKACQKALLNIKNNLTYPELKIIDKGQIILIPVNEVYYCKSELKYTTVKTADKEYISNSSLIQLEETYSGIFIRTHRNAIVAKNKIKCLIKTDDSDDSQWVVELYDLNEQLPVSRRQLSFVRDALKSNTH